MLWRLDSLLAAFAFAAAARRRCGSMGRLAGVAASAAAAAAAAE
jgi:hypothetical protein